MPNHLIGFKTMKSTCSRCLKEIDEKEVEGILANLCSECAEQEKEMLDELLDADDAENETA